MESAMTPGEDFYVADLETKAGTVTINMPELRKNGFGKKFNRLEGWINSCIKTKQ
jgi:hypothetical protein